MKKVLIIVLACAVLLSACNVTVRVDEKVSETTSATADTSPVTSEPEVTTTQEPVTTLETTTEVTTSDEETTTEETTALPEVTTTQETSQEPIVTQPVVPTFSFSEEFYTRLADIFNRYQLNQNCNGDPVKCTCNPEYEKVDAEGNVITPRDRVMSIYFYDVETGYEAFVNSGVHYPVASIVKIPYCVFIYEKLTSGEISPDLVLTYEKRHHFHGTGIIAKGSFGDQYTVLQLLKLAVTESDNVAFEMLKDLSTWEEFTQYCIDNGFSHETDTRAKYQKLCLESAGASGRMLARFLQSDSPFVDDFKYDLTHTKNRMIRSTYTVYRKYGWTKFAFHDVAYIDAPHPYVLVVLTNIEGEENIDYILYKEVSMLVEEFSQTREETSEENNG